jgi:RNA polymerase sigma factor for flagellar operon FliA
LGSTWSEYARGQRQPAIEQLVEAYSHLVDFQVQRVLVELPASVDRDDLLSEARIGLIDAINRFDEGKGVKFETYASIRIKGAIVDYLRKLDWAPRSLRHRAREIAAAQSELEQELGSQPTEEQLARKMGLDLEAYRRTLSDLSVLGVLSFRDLEDDEGGEFQVRGEGSEPWEETAKKDFTRCLAQSIDLLPQREREVLEMYYTRGLALKEIGAIMELSESRICQIHSSAVVRLRGLLVDWRGQL